MPKTIMIVDDSPSMRQMVKLTLSAAGYGVIEAADGQQALDKAKVEVPSMAITDLNMPVMDGLNLIRELRKLASWTGVPIVFLTTESDDAKKQQAKAAGATGWITKPFKQEMLLSVVRKCVG